MITRRRFIQVGATTGAGLMLSGVAPSFTLPHRRAMEPIRIQPQQKALVFIMLDGGNDSFNMLVPTSYAAYAQYRNTRRNLALRPDQLLPLPNYTDSLGRTFGVHHSMPEVQKLFEQKQLAFIANIGPMVEPVSKTTYQSGQARLPLGLLSHADQFKHWQTSRPDQRINQGWFGYFADSLQPNRPANKISMNISLSGSNIMQNGVDSSHYSITDKGSVGLAINEQDTVLNKLLFKNFEGLLNENYGEEPFKQTYLALIREAHAQHEIFRKATEQVQVPTEFSDSALSQQLRKVAQTIKASANLNHQQQTFFLRYIGWDHHDELLNNHARMLRVLSKALGEFQQALNNMGIAERVLTFTGSDFGRTLTSNGNGTDHGWGGNTLLMGAPVPGGAIYGQYPALSLGDNNPLDVGDGVLLPTMPTDLLYSVIARWFGVEQQDMPRLFPNLSRFNRRPRQRNSYPLPDLRQNAKDVT
jgi:uncharacterized protein (DUF1501 family)